MEENMRVADVSLRLNDLKDSIAKALEADAKYQSALSWPKFIVGDRFLKHVDDCMTAAYELGLRTHNQASHVSTKRIVSGQ